MPSRHLRTTYAINFITCGNLSVQKHAKYERKVFLDGMTNQPPQEIKLFRTTSIMSGA